MEVNQDQNVSAPPERESGSEVDKEVMKAGDDEEEAAEPPSKKLKITEHISRNQNQKAFSKEEPKDECKEGEKIMGKQRKLAVSFIGLSPIRELKEEIKGKVEDRSEEEVYPGQLIPKEELKNEYGEGERNIRKSGLGSKITLLDCVF